MTADTGAVTLDDAAFTDRIERHRPAVPAVNATPCRAVAERREDPLARQPASSEARPA